MDSRLSHHRFYSTLRALIKMKAQYKNKLSDSFLGFACPHNKFKKRSTPARRVKSKSFEIHQRLTSLDKNERDFELFRFLQYGVAVLFWWLCCLDNCRGISRRKVILSTNVGDSVKFTWRHGAK